MPGREGGAVAVVVVVRDVGLEMVVVVEDGSAVVCGKIRRFA